MKRNAPHLPTSPVAWTIAAFVLSASPHLLAMPPVLSGLVLVAAGWRLLAAQRRWRLPPGWIRILLSLSAIVLLAISYGGLWGRRAATGLLCLMLGAKMLELFRVRDLRMVASVSLFLVTTQFLFNERLLYIGYLMAGVLASVCALLAIQRFEQGNQRAPGSERRILREGAMMLLAALPVAAVLFLTFPRLAQPLWGLPDEVMDARTGLSDTMSPGSIAELYADDSPAFRAEFEGGPPPPGDRYWRGPVLWNFDGDTWERAFLPSRTPTDLVPPGSNDYIYNVQLEPHERRWLFALDYPVTLPENARISLDYQLTARKPITALTQYRMRSNPDPIDMPQLPETLRQLATRLPADRNPRTREMAESLRSRFGDDRELIAHVLDWFRQEPFYYSLETSPLGRHNADEFLFDVRTGFCEYYASAFAVIMRFADIPTRVVTGYQGGYWQSGGEYLLVRNSDAHAWVEVWLEGSGWTRVDPTAAVSPQRIQRGASSIAEGRESLFDMAWLRDLRNRYDRLQYLWNAWILGFDAERQQRMMRFLGLPDISRTGMALIMAASLGVIVLVVAWAWLRDPRGSRDPVRRAWLRLLRRVGRRGLAKRPSETPLAWARRVAPALAGGDRLVEITGLYNDIRYGDRREESLRRRFTQAAGAFRPEPLGSRRF
ncbi:MAG: DUF3488 domain-containing protein [Gammaproteobacteria bacterium]|jgi:transglutaminase-like putative cysteine protease|nr:DUF3488 domain-containing protein [Gammaproteobacteria bacterium]